jgi:hypothetical protein
MTIWQIYTLQGVFARVASGHPVNRRIEPAMNNLSRDRQIAIIACLTEGQSIRATERITGIHRDTIMRLGARVGRGCAELHDRMMVGIRAGRLELDEIWGYVGKKQKRVLRHEIPVRAISTRSLEYQRRLRRSSATAPASAIARIRTYSSRICASA